MIGSCRDHTLHFKIKHYILIKVCGTGFLPFSISSALATFVVNILFYSPTKPLLFNIKSNYASSHSFLEREREWKLVIMTFAYFIFVL